MDGHWTHIYNIQAQLNPKCWDVRNSVYWLRTNYQQEIYRGKKKKTPMTNKSQKKWQKNDITNNGPHNLL